MFKAEKNQILRSKDCKLLKNGLDNYMIKKNNEKYLNLTDVMFLVDP